MAAQVAIDPLKTKLLELLASNEEETICKDALLDLLESVNQSKSLPPIKTKKQVHFNADNSALHPDLDILQQSLTPTDWDTLPSLPTTRTIRYIDTTNTKQSGFSGRTPTEETVSEIDEYRFMGENDDDVEDNLSIDGNIPYLNWTNYALSHLKHEDQETLQYYSNKDLFIVLSDYVFIYSKPGNKHGVPWDYNDKKELSITGILNKYELILIDTKQRDYTTECYLKCLLPLAGWVYLPQIIINKWIKSDKECAHAMKLRSEGMHDDDDDDSISATLRGSNYHRIDMEYVYNIQTGSVINDNNYIWKQLDYLEEDIAHDNNDINFKAQRLAPLVHPLPKSIVMKEEDVYDDDDEDAKHKDDDEILKESKDEQETKVKRIINWIVRWMRAHPFFPGLAIVVIQAGIECVIFFDIITDFIVVYQLSHMKDSFLLSLFFTFSIIFLVSPYIIGWVSILQFMLRHFYKKFDEYQKLDEDEKKRWKYRHYTANVLFILFNILPFGVMTLFILDIVHLLEYVVVRPIAYLSSCLDYNWCKCCVCSCKLRNISFEELGYWKLRRVSEIYAETIPQSVLQLLLLLLLSSERARNALDLNVFTVVLALFSSVIVTLFWIAILLFESKTNGMSFVEYMTVVFQGSFKFVPYLPAIERGTKTGIDVNWTRYKLDVEGAGLFAKALQNTNCQLRRLKISLYSIKELHRNACKYFGSTCREKVELIISREEEDIKHLFRIYDIDDNYYFDFEEFSRCCIVMRKDVQKSVNLYTVSSLFWELVASEEKKEIYLLDLLIKMGGSKNKIPLLDYDNTLHFATKNKHLNLISLLIGYAYDRYDPFQFEQCVIYSVINPDYERCALALCEERGVPIVVEIISAKLKRSCNPSVVVSIGDIELTSETLYNTERPIWHRNNKLLFIVPFAQIDKILEKNSKHYKSEIKELSPKSDAITKAKTDTFNIVGFYDANAALKDEEEESNSSSLGLSASEKEILRKTETAIDLVVGEKKEAILSTSPPEEAILRELEYLAAHDDTDNIFKESTRKRDINKKKAGSKPLKPADIKLHMEINDDDDDSKDQKKEEEEKETAPADRDYHNTLFKINSAAVLRDKRRRNSYSTTHSVNKRYITVTPIADEADDDAVKLKDKLLNLWSPSLTALNSVKKKKATKRLIIYVKLNDNLHTNEDEFEIDEEIIGGCKIKIDAEHENIFKFHEKSISQTLHHTNNVTKRFMSVGKLKMRIYLNVLHKYDKCDGLKYIDTELDK